MSESKHGLTTEHVEQIYLWKLVFNGISLPSHVMHSDVGRSFERMRHTFPQTTSSTHGLSNPLSKIYEVTPKTIRDIWNRSSWKHATKHLWVYEKDKVFYTAFFDFVVCARLTEISSCRQQTHVVLFLPRVDAQKHQ